MTLFAYCKVGQVRSVKRIPMIHQVQMDIEAVFITQCHAFTRGRPNESVFDGDWKPDEDELLTLAVNAEVQTLIDAAEGNALALPVVDVANFEAENIRALFTVEGGAGNKRLLVQRFTARQLLNRKHALLLHNNSFRELTEAAFTIGSSLACVVEGGLVKFDSYHNLRAIFDLSEYYEEATDEDIDELAGHASLDFLDLPAFKSAATQTIRKLVHKVIKSGVLNNYTPAQIQTRAAETGLNLAINNGVIQVPTDKALARQFFSFLDDSLYEASLSRRRYLTNSKRAI